MTVSTSQIYDNYSSYRPTATGGPSQDYFKANLGPMIDSLNLKPNARILEIGPGRGELQERLRKTGFIHLESFEICDEYRQSLRERGFKVYDGQNLRDLVGQLPDNYFDVMLAMDVFEHIPLEELTAFLLVFKKKLKKAGSIIGQLPNSSGLFGQNTFLADITHITEFNEARLDSVLAGSGYENIFISETKLPSSPANLIRSISRFFIFKLAYLMSRIVGACPNRCMAHLIMFQAKRPD